ncbi:MAG: BREX-1 system adenine-specific DNA-methyltransferase PglX, partial [Desulfobacterales bacterium]|nr:BREX-1 system adenine-specific DNA-methyltransferase PglX [Desulfobacterales bacterium]
MNRNKLKAYAPRARSDFIKTVTDSAAFYGLTKEKIEPATKHGDVAIIGGKPFPRHVAKKRKRLEERIRREGFEQVMEAMAYTWFNRFVAIRYMELHGYLEHGYRVLSTTNHTNDTDAKNRKAGSPEIPDILRYAEHVDLPELNHNKVVELKLAGNRDEELYRMLLIAQCNALHKAMPFLFGWIGDAAELLLPENLLHSDSLIRKMVNEIPEEEWQEVEIIGWLYQFYISEKKDQVIGKVVKSEDIPAATQLFTPNWIVKYMVQNTLGRQWMATYPNSPLKQQMEYYIEPAEQMPEVQEQLKSITPESLNPEELTLLDPACGSGHILVEAYDLFKAIYQERGYRAKDIPRLILEKNLYGLEIDDRAAQLAAFALMMKARADDRRIFDNGTKPHVLAIQESKGMDAEKITEALNAPIVKGEISQDGVTQLIQLFEHGKTFGSLIRVSEELAEKLSGIRERVENMLTHGDMFGKAAARAVAPIVDQARILAGNYDASVTNPPYMGSGGMNPQLKLFAKDRFPDSKADLFAMFIERNLDFVGKQSVIGMITMQSWMFLSSFEKLRAKLLDHHTVLSMAHLGPRAFDSIGGEVVSTTSFIIRNSHHPEYKGTYVRLVDGTSEGKKDNSLREAIKDPNCGWFYRASAADFKKIPGSPTVYWASNQALRLFQKRKSLSEKIETREGLTTGSNDLFLRLWHEVPVMHIGFDTKYNEGARRSGKRWFTYVKGGDFRRWSGNFEYIVNWFNDGEELLIFKDPASGRVRSHNYNGDYAFRTGFTWSGISSGAFAVRHVPNGFMFDAKGPMGFSIAVEEQVIHEGFLNSVVTKHFIKMLAPTLDFKLGHILNLPLTNSLPKEVKTTSKRAVELSFTDWNDREASWDFSNLPLLKPNYRQSKLKSAYTTLRTHWRNMTLEMQRLEEENNRIFIEAYGLQDELTPDVPLSEITLTCNPHYRYGGDKSDEELEALLLADTIKELISYAIGCMMGRYSLDQPGLIYAHSGNDHFWEIYHQKHNKPVPPQNKNHSCDSWSTFPPDQDGIIPITDIDWFQDDAINRFIEFSSVAWPKEH